MQQAKYYITTFLLAIAFTINAQLPTGPEIAWQRCYGEENTQRFSDAILLNSGKIISIIVTDTALVMKFNSEMEIEWQKIYSDTGCERSPEFVHGLTNGHLIFFGYAGIGCPDFHGNTDFYLMETDADGNLLWEKCYGSPGFEEIEGFIATSDKGFLIQGRSRSVGGDIPFHYGDGFTTDAVIIKTDSTGTIEWVKILGGTNNDSPLGNPLEVSPGIYQVHIGGYSDDFDFPPLEGSKRWIIEMDNTGEIIKENWIIGDNDILGYSGELIKYGTNKTMFVSGGNTESTNFPAPEGHAMTDGAISIFNSDLQLIDMRLFGGSDHEVLKRVTKDGWGNYYLLGISKSSDYDLPANYGSFDYWIMMVDSNLNLQWSKNLGGSNSYGDGSNTPFRAALVYNNNYLYAFLASRINGSLPDFDIECSYDNSSDSDNDVWLVTFDITTTNTEEPEDIHTINIYPNPSENYFNIEFSDVIAGDLNIEIYNITGQLIYTKSSNYNKIISISTKGLNSGFCTIVIRNENSIILSIQHIVL